MPEDRRGPGGDARGDLRRRLAASFNGGNQEDHGFEELPFEKPADETIR